MEAKLSLLILCLGLQYAYSQEALTRTLLPTESYLAEGALCLDGSAPGYYMRRGTGEGANKWVLHLIGGGWCTTSEQCLERSQGLFGSNRLWGEELGFTGILSPDTTINPDFYNWNHVALIYCDGGSFAGDREEPDVVQGANIYYRGYRILKAIMRHLNEERGLSNATDFILTGCSAGATGVFLHADFVRTLIPGNTKYRAFPDAGYFFDLAGNTFLADIFSQLSTLQNLSEAINPSCRQENEGREARCITPQVLYNYITTPIFVLNSQYDSDIIRDTYMQACIPPNCDAVGSAFFKIYKQDFDASVQPVLSSPQSNGYFLDSCYVHCQTVEDANPWNNYAINGSSIQQAFGNWYFERPANTRLKDCDFPCNPTCSAIPDGAAKNLANPLAFFALLVMASLA